MYQWCFMQMFFSIYPLHLFKKSPVTRLFHLLWKSQKFHCVRTVVFWCQALCVLQLQHGFISLICVFDAQCGYKTFLPCHYRQYYVYITDTRSRRLGTQAWVLMLVDHFGKLYFVSIIYNIYLMLLMITELDVSCLI